MASEIEFKDAEFSFKQDGIVFQVRTEVAPDAFASVVVQELREQPAMEPEEE